MNFFRRLTGQKAPVKDSKDKEESKSSAPDRTPVITGPETVINITPPSSAVAGTTPSDTKIGPIPVLPPDNLNLYGVTKQLPPVETIVGKPGRHLVYGLKSDIGMVRNNNQDSVLALFSASVSADGVPDFGLFIVADGMGGHHDGERASAIAVRSIASFMTNQLYLKLLDRSQSDEQPIVSEILSNAVQAANEAVAREIPEGGTTVTAATIVGDMAYIAHVGDSRAYLLTTDGLDQVTRDHSLVQRLIELDQLTAEEAASHPQKNVLYRALGQSDHVEIDTVTRRLPPGSRLLLCSDGLWNFVPEEKLTQLAANTKTPQDACDKLVQMANDRGGQDNITVLIVQAPG